MNEWYKDWFNSDFYLHVYSHRNNEDAKKLVGLILSKIKLPPSAKILDSSCGNGRHAILFAKKGYEVTGFDLSTRLLELAAKECEIQKLNVKLVRADIRNFCVKEKFDLIVNLFTSFGYFESDEENFLFFKNALKMMHKESFLIFDYFNYDYIVNNLVEEDFKRYDEILVRQKRKIIDERIIKEITIEKNGEKFSYNESVKLYRINELVDVFTKFGFKPIEFLGDYYGNSFSESDSPRLIMIMKI